MVGFYKFLCVVCTEIIYLMYINTYLDFTQGLTK